MCVLHVLVSVCVCTEATDKQARERKRREVIAGKREDNNAN